MYSGVPINWAKPVKSVLSVRLCPVALAMPKSMTLGTGTPSMTVTRMFEGLMSRWMIPFWWACCTAWQTCTNKLQPLGDRQSWCWSQYSVIGMPRTSSMTK